MKGQLFHPYNEAITTAANYIFKKSLIKPVKKVFVITQHYEAAGIDIVVFLTD